MNIIITGGGTGGHLYPGLEIAKHFQKQNHKVYYIASLNGVDKKIIQKEKDLDNIEFLYWDMGGFSRSLRLKKIIYNIRNLIKLQKLIKKSKKFIISKDIDIVIGVGGYISYPVLKGAIAQNIKTIIHEQNSYPGIANQKISKNIDYLTGAYPKSQEYLKGKFINASNPRVDNAIKYLNKDYKEQLSLTMDKPIILFLGGSLGADTINEMFIKFIKQDIHNEYQAILISGMLNNEIENIDLKQNIVIESTNELLKYMASSDYIISRGGATSILEIIYLEKKSIIIPSPNVTANHQYYNAKEFLDRNMLYMIEEKDLNFNKLMELFVKLQKDRQIKINLQKYDKILSLEVFDKLVRSIDEQQ